MPVKKARPTSPGRRAVVIVTTPGLHKGEPHAPLLERKNQRGGRNNMGRITTRHQGGGHKQHYRLLDFKRDKDGISGRVEHIEYDPIARRTSRWCSTRMGNAATSLRPRMCSRRRK